MAKREKDDHEAFLSQSSLSPLTRAMEVSQQSNAEGTFNGDTIHLIYKYISKDLPRIMWEVVGREKDASFHKGCQCSYQETEGQMDLFASIQKQEFMSSQAKAVIKTMEDYLQPQFGPNRLLHSAAVSEGSGLQDCSTHQTASDHSHDEISDPYSYKSNSKNNSCFISASKRNRPVSAPVGQLRVAEFSSLKFQPAQNWHRLSHKQKLHPRVITVTAYKNGSRTVCAKVTVPTITLLLEECTEKLNLNMAARRVFLADGTEALKPEDIPHEADVYVSTGEPFLDPFKKIKDHLLLMKKVTWTMNGLMLPTDIKRQKTKPVLSVRMKKLSEKTSVRILFFKNGMGQDGHEITVGKETIKKVLDTCTMKMKLNLPARYLYDLYGRKIKDISKVPLLEKCLQNSITPLRGPVWVSKGEGFSPSGAKMYIQGVLLALYQRLKSAKKYYTQLNLAVDEQKEKITEKVILSMTAKEYHKAQEEVSRLIDELQTAIKSNRGHLSKLGPQLQAEQEQFSSYVYQHIKSLPANTVIPGGLQLKIFENGKDTGEVSVCISKKDLESNSPFQTGDMMENLLLKIHQRFQGSPINPSGLNFSSIRLFDEHGQEIKNPLLLKNEQKIWVSYGKAYRSPLNPVLSLTFDQVTTFDRDGITVAYKTSLDPNAVLLPGCDNWEVCEGFPINSSGANQPIPDQFEKVDLEDHFLQNKVDPNIVLHATVSIRRRSSSSREASQGGQTVPSILSPAASVWLITKTGMILSRVITQGCLAIGHPIRVKAAEGTSLEGYKLILQKRHKGDNSQKWVFGTDSCIYSKAYPQFVLTFLEELTAQVDVTQTEYHIHHGARTTTHQEHGSSLTEEVLQKSATVPGLKQLPEPSDTHLMPEGSLGETRQLTVALVRKLEEKHPKASAQRWAIKHEGTNKPGQWKHSRVENPLWNKLTYMWPVLPSGQLNEEFDWPIEGLLIPNSPPMKRSTCKTPEVCVPVRLRVLRNGDKNKSRAFVIIGPDISPGQKKQNVDAEKKKNVENHITKYSETETTQSEFHQLLERCTEILNLPSAARRLFDEKGREIFALKDIQRDELVYVSCGEHWINPDVSIAQQKKQIFLRNLASDISKIQTFCSIHKIEALVLEVQSDIVSGAKLAVHKPVAIFGEEKQIRGPKEKQMQENALTTENASSEILDSHARTHLRMKACHTLLRYAWQETPHDFDEDDSLPKKMEEELFENVEPQKKYSYSPKQSKLQKLCHQQFEYRDGQIISHAAPQLVLGVQGPDLRSGMEVVLVEKKVDDSHQRWMHKEDSRTFHLVSNPDLVLAVSMTKTRNEVCGSPVIVQKYKPYNNGTSNQKWNYVENIKAFVAFHSTVLDKEITAANYAGICTSSVIKGENIDQPGYYYLSPTGKKKTMLCLACGQSMRAEKGLKQLLPGLPFLCASGSKIQKPFSRGPFKVISVAEADLSSCEAEKTLSYYEERLLSLRMKTCTRVVSHSGTAALHQKAVKIIAYKNGDGYRNGKLIVAGTFPTLLTECTEQLGLTRAASKVYTKDGTTVLSLRDLVLWALDESFIQRNTEKQKKETAPVQAKETTIKSMKENPRMKMKTKSVPKSVISDSLDGIDKSLLTFILRNPIAIWVSCGEPFLSPKALQKAEKLEKQNWLKKDKILADLDTMKHKMRQLKGRRVAACQPAAMVPNKSPVQPVVVEGGWTEQTQEEIKLMELIRHTEAHLSAVQELQSKRNSPVETKSIARRQSSLYKQPNTKRVWIYLNGGRPEDGTYAWGKTISELLDDCTSRLKMAHPARTLYTPDGEPIHSWDDVERDMVICVSTGHGFITQKELKQLTEVRANYARIRRQQGPEATNIVVSQPDKLQFPERKLSSPICKQKTMMERSII
ncbi:doublecortin domain-containing protein 1 isoform X4 [Canis lupus familiaris]|nr:doublecortin domain-containing protein 1 isoform X4 [Canis lupus familiaris]XP_038310281.1 doublecortin domain-containing protein 1 isoform X4 [Canis lupus familiaris]XP_038310282.1 doublecortin domain-containing protein 1 isoform X4 [Canis lupus familiaris]XP_038310283.1 doublecortin domain-containing protein 1 isoform X4 [Canis lupus familiaris]XP_038310284.1 doublecortin domain-containing protein 1 isoform X4 [Canis lupus familiaris]XP_038310285.1 doublecortin domain-containing protein 1